MLWVEGTASAKAPRQKCIGFLGKGEVASVGGAGVKGVGLGVSTAGPRRPPARTLSFVLECGL